MNIYIYIYIYVCIQYIKGSLVWGPYGQGSFLAWASALPQELGAPPRAALWPTEKGSVLHVYSTKQS